MGKANDPLSRDNQKKEESNEGWTASEIEEIVILARFHLYNRGLPSGPKAIKNYLATQGSPIPPLSETAIQKILRRQELTNGRVGP